MNFFELYQIPQQFDVDLANLSQAYQLLALRTHPDKFATGSAQDKLLAVQKNAQVNDGYQVLKSPLSRAEHMLELRGVELKHEQITMQDIGFLMQQMEWREALEAIDSENKLDALEQLDDEIKSQIKSHLSQLDSQLSMHSEQGDNDAADEVRKLKFLYKLRHEIELKEDILSDI